MTLGDNLTQYTLTDLEPFHSSSTDKDNRIVFIMLGFTDLNAIKYRSNLATSRDNTYISITDFTVVDLNNNPVVATPVYSGLQARIHTPDTTSPILVNYTLDMDSTTLILTFNETVNTSSLDVSHITIQHNTTSSTDYHSSPRSLTPHQTHTLSDNGHVVVIHLGPLDRNEIKRRQNLAISEGTTYLTGTPLAIRDMNGNQFAAIPDGAAQQVAVYIADESPPLITNVTVDMDAGLFVLTFSETVNASTLLLHTLTLQDGETLVDLNFTLSGGNSSQSDSTIIPVEFTIEDLNEIKRLTICRESDNCFLLHEFAAIFDMMSNPIQLRSDGFGLQVLDYIPDMTSPELVRFDTNLTSETITLTFTETVNASSLNILSLYPPRLL